MWMKKERGSQSVTLTFFSIGFIFALFKLMFSGIHFGAFTMPEFSGTDFAAVVGSLGGVYALRKMGPKNDDTDQPG